MPLTLAIIEGLAPDQASLTAAARQRGDARWRARSHDAETGLIWGDCQGSGANPYRVAADTTDGGFKCTCPSRKLPCKHALALMWTFVERPEAFGAAGVPDWVREWVSRRRKPTTEAPKPPAKRPARSLAEADADSAPEPGQVSGAVPDAAAERRRQRATERRAQATAESVSLATRELEQWIADQLRTGLTGLIDELGSRCRRIAARLVDAKAAALASRVDEMPASVLSLAREEQPDAVIGALGRLTLLARAWRADPDAPELRREVVSTESRDDVLASPDATRIASSWEVVGEQVVTRRDRLISQSTWLLDVGSRDGTVRFALLQDFFPVTRGRRGRVFGPGDRIHAELAFYPATRPLRAIVVSQSAGERADRGPAPLARVGDASGAAATGPASASADGQLARPEAADRGSATRNYTELALPTHGWPELVTAHPLDAFFDHVEAAPWAELAPVLLPAGRVCVGTRDRFWWSARDGSCALPIEGTVSEHVLGMELYQTAATWNGHRLSLLAAQSDWGRLALDA